MRDEIKLERRLEKLKRRTKQIWVLIISMIIVALLLMSFNVLVVPPIMLMVFMVGLIITLLDNNLRE